MLSNPRALIFLLAVLASDVLASNVRRPANDAELQYWLENMVLYHKYSDAEVAAATGLSPAEISAALKRFDISAKKGSSHSSGDKLTVLPYPGGRHPRIGFLDGAIEPQRETKISVFTPWDKSSYVVVDVPEAIWYQSGLLYLAHTHVPTVWSKQDIKLEPLEWNRRADGALDIERTLPNKVRFGARIVPQRDVVEMTLWLTNNSRETLRDLRVQNCVMLKGATGFTQQTNVNKVFSQPYVACHSSESNRWIITAWEPCHRAWANPPVPCLHSDPKFPDCPPGEGRILRGRLWFYEGPDIHGEFARLDKTNWRHVAE